MPRTIYAFLVAVDEYDGDVTNLSGCVNDVEAMGRFLKNRVDGDQDVELKTKVLTNYEAKREAVITGFRDHLGKAQADDVVLFYFSGHGSQEHAPPEFWDIDPDHLNETLVCHDSRTDGSWDLADKELAKLIEEVARNQPHIAVVLDCCHSGSGTRNLSIQQTTVRRLGTDVRQRPIESYLFSLKEARDLTPRDEPGQSGWYAGRHVLMAACREDEEALEIYADGKHRGAFSHYLLDSLSSSRGKLTYRDLFARTNAFIRSRVRNQSPQLETIEDAALDAVFLDGSIRAAPLTYTASVRDGEWFINGGSVHGIPPVVAGDDIDGATILELFPMDATTEELADPLQAAAQAEVIEVGPAESRLEILGGKVLLQNPHKAKIVSLPVPRMSVEISGNEPAGIEMARQALVKAESGKPSLYIREAENRIDADYRLIVSDGQFVITNPESDRAMADQLDGINESNAVLSIQRLEHIARWALAQRLENPGSTINKGDIEVIITKDGTAIRGPEIRLEYQYQDGEWKEPEIHIKLKNNSDRKLYCGLLDLTERFKISAALQSNLDCIPLEPNGHEGDEWSVLSGQPIYLSIPDKFWRQGVAEYRDVLKLIVSTQEFDARLMEQDDIGMPRTRSAGTTRSLGPSPASNGSLNRLMNRIHDPRTRDMGGSRQVDRIDDWWATELTFTTVRPLESVTLGDRTVRLTGGVQLEPHPHVRARARLSPTPVAARSIGNLSLPRILRDDPSVVQPFSFLATRSGDPGANVLELENVENWESVTPEQPLRLQVPQTVADDEHVLPVAWDGEFFLPVGKAKLSSGGVTDIVLERLPEPTSAGRRGVARSIRIFFQKVSCKVFGREFTYPRLAMANVDSDGVVVYENNKNVVSKKVGDAMSIVLFIHGIFGDTRNMASCLKQSNITSEDGQTKPVAELFDLVLTFDYENLNTPIEDIARDLKQRLADVGLVADHDKRLTIVAHSMGGLVSRWFIEREQGNKVVAKLVMAGTPNAGSPWPTLQGWATFALAMGLNGLSLIAWPAGIAGGLLSAVETVGVNLDQMDPKSKFFRNLSTSPDPDIPYVMLAGNTSIIPAVNEEVDGKRSSRIQRLYRKLFPRKPLHVAADPVFFGKHNDIAVSVESMEAVAHSLETHLVGCDHLTYFSHPVSLKKLAHALS